MYRRRGRDVMPRRTAPSSQVVEGTNEYRLDEQVIREFDEQGRGDESGLPSASPCRSDAFEQEDHSDRGPEGADIDARPRRDEHENQQKVGLERKDAETD